MLQTDNLHLTTLAFAIGVLSIFWVGSEFGVCQASQPRNTSNRSPEQASADTEEHVQPDRIRNRLVVVGLSVGILLALLGVVFVYLRMNHATRGFYNGRLQTLTLVCLIAILVASYFLWARILFK